MSYIKHTVDGRNSAPGIALLLGFHTSQLVGLGISEPSTVCSISSIANGQGHHDAVAVLLTADIVGDQREAALHVAVDKGNLANNRATECPLQDGPYSL